MSWNSIKKILVCAATLFCQSAMAISVLPGSIDPGRVQENYLPQQSGGPPVGQPIKPPPVPAESLGPEAKKIKFRLNAIILEGNHIYSTKQLSTLYQNQLHKEISIVDLQTIVQSITNYYRNNGYILSRAILPPQEVRSGVVRIRILEGYIDQVRVIGTPRGSERIMLDYGKEITKSRPLKLSDMEHYLLLANQIPGTTVKSILEPSKKQTAASDLNLSVDQALANFSIAYDNYGTLYIGPHQVTGIASLNSVVGSGDMIRLTYLGATHNSQLHYYDLAYQTPIGIQGLTLTAGGNQSLTAPGFVLEPLEMRGKANTYYIALQYPLILTRSEYLFLDGGFNYIDSGIDSFDEVIYLDHIRPVRFGGSYSFSDRYNGTNLIAAHIEQGLHIWGASNDPESTTTSHFGADGIFTKETVEASHLQPIYDTRFSIYLYGQGQYSNRPLLATEQFGFGGSLIGRGYDPAELLGDRGIAGTVELRMNTYPEKIKLNLVQFYVFYDVGKVWDIEESPGVPQELSAASAGVGARFSFTRFVSGNLMFTQVLTKPIASEELIHRGKNPKTFFSVVAAI